MARLLSLSFVALLALGCSTDPRTEVIVVIDSDLMVPSELDELTIDVTAPDGEMQSSTAALGDGEPTLPRTLGLLHTGGSLGPFAVTATGLLGGSAIVSRDATFEFQPDQTLVLTMHLVRDCITASCGGGQTCTESGCQSPDSTGRLTVWTGTPPRLGEVPDMDLGVPEDACAAEVCNGEDDDCDGTVDEDVGGSDEVCNDMDDDCDGTVDEDVVTSDETCNDVDDDCDGTTDEGFDTNTDPMNCGGCGVECIFRNGSGTCSGGSCVITGCDTGFEDCDTDGANGCETNTTSDANHCGGCNNSCEMPVGRICCMSGCQRDSCA